MPRDKIIEPKPECYTLWYREHLGATARTEALGKEKRVEELPRVNSAKELEAWVEQNGVHHRVYVIRNRKDEMVKSLVWKDKRQVWGPINAANYAGGYCIGTSKGNVHPTMKAPIEE